MGSRVHLAAAQYPIDILQDWDAYQSKLSRWVAEAAAEAAQILVFPEYGAMEIASMLERRRVKDRRSRDRHTLGPLPAHRDERRVRPDLHREIDFVQSLLPQFRALHAELAQRQGVYLLAGSLPVRGADGRLRNTAYFFAPDGTMGWQEKIIPTRWEHDLLGVMGGREIRYFETKFGPIGIAICYDVEFPMIARSQAEARAAIILAPCCTNSLRGYHRVRVGARARALENQAYVVLSPTIGAAPWSSTVDFNTGSAGIFAPPDLGPNVNGIVAQGTLDVPQWVHAEVDLGAIERIRLNGELANRDHWEQQGVGSAVEGRFQAVG
jgi:predicted amidohydrolase